MSSPAKRSPTSSLESPSKRRRLSNTSTSHDTQPISISRSYSLPTTPSSRFRHSQSLFTPSSSYSSTQTCYPTYPIDSPTNPFGRKRSLLPQLPAPTKFSRHVVLRFQLFRRGIEGGVGKERSEGVYRVVQVPLAYTFQHLKELIGFLFGGEKDEEREEDGQGQEEEHLFEIRRDVEMCSRAYRRGKVKKSRVETRLSSSRDPYRWKTEWDSEFDADSFFGATQKQEEDEDAEGEDDDEEEIDELDEEVKWEAEEDLTLAHVWIPPSAASASESDEDEDEDNGTDDVKETKPSMLSVAIVYFHISAQAQTQIHITLNDEPLPPNQRRRGKGNAPYVFKARGRVSLSPRNEEDEAEEDYTKRMSSKLWNKPGDAFEKYLKRSVTLKMPSPIYRHAVSSSTSLVSTPGLTTDDVDFSSSPVMPKSSPFPSSSPFISRSYSSPSSLFSPRKSSTSLFSSARKSVSSLFSSSSTSPRKRPLFPTQTPALPPAQRKRMAYIKKRIERSKEKTRHRNRGKKKVENEAELVDYDELVDQLNAELEEDDDDEKDKEKEQKGKIRMGDGRYLTVREAMEEVGVEQEV
ncbi:hypothetical protein WG66_000930 [Moniliophthora roreri]|uniref:Uncharacterized protein n=1 Tax=Moniliophthora roreri TaxID=221103 RepID=A0A0W0F1F7_MONRR|nr:hypothetical protein WG66_000930 [Moniliophthora roreri]